MQLLVFGGVSGELNVGPVRLLDGESSYHEQLTVVQRVKKNQL